MSTGNDAFHSAASETAGWTFQQGDLVSGRFRIERAIARGGGGEVYEARDQELGERVALKTVRAEIAENEEAVKRFKREILLARKVTHRNVCRIFDVFQHNRNSRPGLFLTMEFLSGETLTQRITRKGPLTTLEALPMVRQMVDALTAAHQVGVVHRDFKTANVMLCKPAEMDSGGARVVVMDFGLALQNAADRESPSSAVSGSGTILGTPAYMSPEQIEGKNVTSASDIYSLGLVLFEMVTGKLPHAEDSILTAMVKRVKEAPPSPRIHMPDLDPRWEAVILRCMERDPAQRFATAEDVYRALEGEGVLEAPRRVLRRRILLAAVLLAVAAFAAGSIWLLQRSNKLPASEPIVRKRPTETPVVSARPSVAVLGFKNLSGLAETAWLSTALSEMLTAELGAGEKLRTIPGENVVRMKGDLKLPDTDTLANDTLRRIHTNLGTDFVVLGSYLALGADASKKIRLDLRLQDARAGETIATLSDTSPVNEILDLVPRIGKQLREKMGTAPLTEPEAKGARASLPANSEAARLYSEGLMKLRLFDAPAAQERLQKAVEADPKYPLAFSALAEVWSYLGFDDRAREEARKALDLSSGLPREEKLLVEAGYHDVAGDSAKAAEIYGALWAIFPDDLDHGLRFARAQDSAGKSREGMQTLDRLKQLPKPLSDDPRIDLMEARIASSLSDYPRVLVAAQAAIAKAGQRQSRAILGQAHWFSGWAHTRTGHSNKALQEYQSALQIFRETGDKMRVARALYSIGVMLRTDGKIRAAMQMYEESREALKTIGNKQEAGDVMNSLGVAYWNLGMLQQARNAYQEALSLFEQSGDKASTVYPRNNIALVLADQGFFRESWKLYEEVLADCKESGNRYCEGWAKNGMAEILESEGKLADAKKTFEEALTIRTEITDSRNALETRIEIANLALFQSDAATAEKLSRNCIEESRKKEWKEEEGYAQTVLALAMLSQGHTAEARKFMDAATVTLGQTENFRKRIRTQTARASVLAASGNIPEAKRILESALAETSRSGHQMLEFRVRLAFCEVLLWAGDETAARAAVTTLERDARNKGLILIAQKAAELL